MKRWAKSSTLFVIGSIILCSVARGEPKVDNYTRISIEESPEHPIRFASGRTICLESWHEGRWAGRYWSADGGKSAVEFAAPDRSKACATVVRLGPGDDATYIFRPRGLSPAKTYRVTFDSLGETLLVEGLRLIRKGLPLRLESTASSELLLFEAMAPEEAE